MNGCLLIAYALIEATNIDLSS